MESVWYGKLSDKKLKTKMSINKFCLKMNVLFINGLNYTKGFKSIVECFARTRCKLLPMYKITDIFNTDVMHILLIL